MSEWFAKFVMFTIVCVQVAWVGFLIWVGVQFMKHFEII